MLSAIAGNASGDDFASLGNKVLKCSRILVIDDEGLINTEAAYLPPLIRQLISSFSSVTWWSAHNKILVS